MGQADSSRQRAKSATKLSLIHPAAAGGSATGRPGGSARDAIRPDKAARRAYLRQYRQWLWPWRYGLFGLFCLAVAAATLDMVWPLAIRYVIDSVLLAKPTPPPAPAGVHLKFLAALLDQLHHLSRGAALNIFGIVILSVLVLKQAIDTNRSYRTGVLNAKIVFRLRRRLYERLLRLPLGSLAEMKTGGIVSRLSGDVDAISGLVQMALISPGVAIIRIVLTVCILLYLSWRMSAVALVLVPPMAILSLLYTRRVRPWYRSIRNDRGEIDGRLTETFGGIRVVRAFRRERREQRGYALGHHTIIRKILHAQRMELVLESSWGVLLPATSLVIVWFGGWLYLHHPPLAQIGDIFAFQIYIAFLLQPVWSIVSSVSQTQRSLAAMERVFEALAMPEDKPDRPGAIEAPRIVRQFRFDRVGFEYRPGVSVLKDFSLNVPGGSIVALVGPSGAGKTTLTDLVARFQDPSAGSITLNGIDLRDLRLGSYRSLLAVVPQEVFLFDGTVRDNIAYGRRDATDAAVTDAARRANAHGFISDLPEGYNTIVGERGFKLSGGQRQRLSIARAILADPQILILDEATSNLDTESEQLIQSALSELLKSRTTFVIAHRLSTVTHADIIVAMESGQIREVGTHDELMDRRGFYYEMVERQRKTFDADANLLPAVPQRSHA
ncbi:MAG TPA: ABC transporter ATP-binding protein [Tepidisphaeraceae bacterium]|jgi:ATP-binding cassette subfamily B protein/subfamily B ATP-binding cassette protein MsbA|nr:ABC transporter ATP-binding protein [Tepidisphaeraceae bacterium]